MKELLKKLVARLMRPGIHAVDERTREIAHRATSTGEGVERIERALAGPVDERLGRLERRLESTQRVLECMAAATLEREKHQEEMGYWRWLFKTPDGRASLGVAPEDAFARWQRERLLELALALGLGTPDGEGTDEALDAWCASRSAVEIGAGPYPCLAAAPRWLRAVAVDPIARAYAEEGILPAAAGHITYIECPGERIPLPAAFADLVIIENALDHVSDPAAVLTEIRRLLRPDGLLWLLVDLSTHTDHMHPHPFDETRVRGLLTAQGFEVITDRVSDHKSHPKAYGEYRGLLRRAGAGQTAPVPVLEVVVPESARVRAAVR